jgi:hypothetical protein
MKYKDIKQAFKQVYSNTKYLNKDFLLLYIEALKTCNYSAVQKTKFYIFNGSGYCHFIEWFNFNYKKEVFKNELY